MRVHNKKHIISGILLIIISIISFIVLTMVQRRGQGIVIAFLIVGIGLIAESFRPVREQDNSGRNRQDALFKLWVLRQAFFNLLILFGAMVVLDIILWKNTSGGSAATVSIAFTLVILIYTAFIAGIRFQIFMAGHNLQVKDLKQNKEKLKRRYRKELAQKGYLYFFRIKHGHAVALIYWGIIIVLVVYMAIVEN